MSRAFLLLFRPHRRSLAAAAALLAVQAAVPGATVALLHRALSEVRPGDAGRSGGYALAMVAVAAGGAAIGLARAAITRRVAWEVAAELRVRLLGQLLSHGSSSSSGTRVAMLASDVDEVPYAVSAAVTALRNPLTLAALGVAAGTMAPSLLPWVLLLVPMLALPARFAGSWLRERSDAAQRARAAWTALASDQWLGRDWVRFAAATDREVERFEHLARAEAKQRADLDVARTVPQAATEVLVAVAIAGLLWLGGQQVAMGYLEVPAFLGFAIAVGLMHRPLVGLAEVWSLAQRSYAAFARIHRVLSEIGPAPMVAGNAGFSSPTLAWDAVSFRIDGRMVLDRVSLRASPGEILAIVGESGAGKTTLLRLAAGLCAPDSGCVERSGRVGWVDQENFLFARSIGDNLRFVRPEADDAALWSALRIAAIEERVRATPMGLDTPIAELGRSLSGGERQRLGLARALVGDPEILLLDEATNQLDSTTETAILERLQALRPGRIIVWVAHHREIAARADRIFTLAAP
jgi:ABC-type multidrug transport system fused ATPase/permease subunit